MCTETTQTDSTPSQTFDDEGGGSDPTSEPLHARFSTDANADAVVVTIVDTVATVTDREVTAMPPLYATVDSEALATLMTSARGRPIEVAFSYEGCRVTVSSRGEIVVEPPKQ